MRARPYGHALLPKTCPQRSAPTAAATLILRFPAPSDYPDNGQTAEALRSTEVLCASGQERDLQGVFEALVDSTREPLLDRAGLANHQKPLFCRYLSP
jgi:hypothetical protein